LRDYHHVAIQIDFSLVALVSRPPEHRYYDQLKLNEFFSKPHENMKLATLDDYMSFGLHGEYLYQIREKFAFGVSYFMNYQTYSEPESINLFSNALQIKLLIIVKKNERER
jgi:hypothetical protein